MKTRALRLYTSAGLAAALVVPRRPRPRTIQAAAAERSGHRRDVPHRSVRRHVVPVHHGDVVERRARHSGRRHRLQTRSRCGRQADVRARSRPAAGAAAQVPLPVPPDQVRSLVHAEPGHRLQRHPVPRRAAGELVARLENLLDRLRVRFHPEELRLRRLHPRSQVSPTSQVALASPVDVASSRARGRRFPPSAASAASTSCRTSRSPASSPRSSFPTASTTATTRTTSI